MDWKSAGLGLLFATLWSSAFTSARIVVEHAPPFHALSLRFLISGVIALVVARMLGEKLSLTRGQWAAVAVFGLCQNAIYLGLNFQAMQTVEASLAAVIASMLPLIVAAMGRAVFGDRLSPVGYLGLVGGFAGVVLIMSGRVGAGADIVGVGLCLVGAMALAVATLLARGMAGGGNVWTVVGLQMLVGSAALAVIGVSTETLVVNWTLDLGLAFVYTTLGPGLAATVIWFHLIGRIGATRAATFHFLNPFLGVAIAAVVLGETMGPRDVVGVAIVAAGILAVQLSRTPPKAVKA
ncbi:DMT family transporter [Rhodovulum sp. DZ06]|uniref:DMT family transporter n=1 Tax=Rhodovulum sp. DZ06 TaxID=3425126 RepID=UPI003D347A58